MYFIADQFVVLEGILLWRKTCVHLFSTNIMLSYFPDNCVDPIGMANGSIPDASLSDSVGRPEIVNPVNGRLDKAVTDFPFGWSGNPDAPNAQDWLQIDLGSVHKVREIVLRSLKWYQCD